MANVITAGAFLAIVAWMGYFERKSIVVEKTVLIALLSALSAVGRILFAAIPSVQPSSFIIMAAGMCFGPEIGTMTGIVTALASNLALGQGPWTLWQMLAWGLMGLTAGLFRKALWRIPFLPVVFGFGWGFVFGWIMNLWYFVGQGNVAIYLTACITSVYFDLAHALANGLLFVAAGPSLLGRLKRIGQKYGLMTD